MHDDLKPLAFCLMSTCIFRGYSVITYGLGSKKSILHDFHERFLEDKVIISKVVLFCWYFKL